LIAIIATVPPVPPVTTRSVAPGVLAYPEQWERFAEEEGKFLKAEKDRLLYVAATRAGDRLVVTQREKDNYRNPWSPLKGYLDGCEDMAVLKVAAPPKTKMIVVGDGDPAQAADATGERWKGALVRSYDLVAAKAISVTGPAPGATSGEHGVEWGTVIHTLLEAAMREPAPSSLTMKSHISKNLSEG
jgi:ATP-dependent helicase/nuclease subunit A